jgi:hypothetical protein
MDGSIISAHARSDPVLLTPASTLPEGVYDECLTCLTFLPSLPHGLSLTTMIVVKPVIHRIPEKECSPLHGVSAKCQTALDAIVMDSASAGGSGFHRRVNGLPILRIILPDPDAFQKSRSPVPDRERSGGQRLPLVISSKDSPGVMSDPSEDGRVLSENLHLEVTSCRSLSVHPPPFCPPGTVGLR